MSRDQLWGMLALLGVALTVSGFFTGLWSPSGFSAALFPIGLGICCLVGYCYRWRAPK